MRAAVAPLALALIIAGVLLMTCTDTPSAHRTVNISTICLLDGPEYQNLAYVVAEAEKCPPGVDLIVLPHMPFLFFGSGSGRNDLEPLGDLARAHRAYLAASLTEKSAGATFHTAVLIDRGGDVVGFYRKSHAFPDDDGLTLGAELPILVTDFGKVGMTVTTDFYFPEIYTVLSMNGADIITWHHFPERLRDDNPFEPLLMARCLDNHAHMVTAMYADRRTYITHNYAIGMQGAAWGRSMILNRVGTAVAETGYEDGIASAAIDLDKRKQNVYGPQYWKGEAIFFVENYGDRTAFKPIAEPYVKPTPPAYSKRTCRLVVGFASGADMWKGGKVPEKLLALIDEAAALKPDLLLFSEQDAKEEDETTARVMKIVGEKAARIGCYIAIGGLGNATYDSILRLWNRSGKEVYGEPLYWTAGFPEIKVYDTDFGRIGAHECGDLYSGEIDRVLALKGAEIILDASQMWGASGRTNETMLRARALDNAVWIACAHWNTSDASLRSLIVDPYGQVVSASPFMKDGLIAYDIDLTDEKVYYAGRNAEQPTRGESGIPAYYTEDMPEQRWGWREMVFSRRRPELYGIIPTVNEVSLRYRGTWPKK